MTDVAAAVGIHQLARADEMRQMREAIADEYIQRLVDIEEIELPGRDSNRLHAWHLFPIQLRLDALTIDRNQFIDEMRTEGISCSVHWRPLHLHPYYEETFGWRPSDLPLASDTWRRLVSLPLFSSMRQAEIDAVVAAVRTICARGSISRGFKQAIRIPSDRSSVTL
jgi:perosamine synthetase